MATRRVFFFYESVAPRRVTDAEIRGVEEKATKPIKVQSVLIAPLIFDLRERARVFVGSFRQSQLAAWRDFAGAAVWRRQWPSDSLLISLGFVVFECIGRRRCATT